MGALQQEGLGCPGREGTPTSLRANPAQKWGTEQGGGVAFPTGLCSLGVAYQLCPVHDVFPGETLAREFLLKLLLGHLGPPEVGLAHQGSQHIRNAPRACQDQPRGLVLHSPGDPLGGGEGSRPPISWFSEPPPLPSLLLPVPGGEGPTCRGLLPSPHLPPPTSRVPGSPLTSRQRTGISMLLVPGDRAPVRSSRVPGVSGGPGALPVG